jgi:hypothetical protein
MLVETAEKAVNTMNRSDLKFVETGNKKLLFILGIDNNVKDIERIKLLEEVFLNFSPGTIFLERNPKL